MRLFPTSDLSILSALFRALTAFDSFALGKTGDPSMQNQDLFNGYITLHLRCHLNLPNTSVIFLRNAKTFDSTTLHGGVARD